MLIVVCDQLLGVYGRELIKLFYYEKVHYDLHFYTVRQIGSGWGVSR